MKQRVRVEGGFTYLILSDNELSNVLEDYVVCSDLVSPQIEVVDGCLRFRDEDLKLLEPELFYKKDIPNIELDKKHIKLFFGFNLVLILGLLLFCFFNEHLSLTLTVLLTCLVIAFVQLLFYCFYLRLNKKHIQRHRKALYFKAKVTTFFYMSIIQDMMTTNERLQRTGIRQEKEYELLKDAFKDLLDELPLEAKNKYRNWRYPDGSFALDESSNPSDTKFS